MSTVRLHYWAGAREAAGTDWEHWTADSIGEALASARHHRDDRFARVLSVCSLLVDGVVVGAKDLGRPLSDDITVEILPPFAGG